MPRRNLVPVWFGIIVLSGMFLMGQESWSPPPCTDNDGDGYGNPGANTCAYRETDCDDSDPNANPGVIEGPYGDPVCDDKVDNDCDGDVDDLPGGCSLWVMEEIPGGCFSMGDAFGEGYLEELPVHTVCVSTFEMDIEEVTNAEYEVCVAEGPCGLPFHFYSWSRSEYYMNPAYDNFPVIWVDSYRASEYCDWAGKRLPTEAEWEYAARGGLAGKRYSWGDTLSGSMANYYDSGDSWDNDTSPVGKFDANGYGLRDMAGNVSEWVSDWHSSSYYQDCADQGTVSNPTGPTSGDRRVRRGGSFGSNPSYIQSFGLRNAARGYADPSAEEADTGFRCARSLP